MPCTSCGGAGYFLSAAHERLPCGVCFGVTEPVSQRASSAFERSLEKCKPTDRSVEALIKAEHYWVVPGTQLTICALVLRNGFTVTGESACATPEQFRPEVGRDVARCNALQNIKPLECYALRERLIESGVKP